MIPKKIYLSDKDLQDNVTSEMMVACNERTSRCNVEYTNLSQVWHHPSEFPEDNLSIICQARNGEVWTKAVTKSFEGRWQIYTWKAFAEIYEVKSWAYINDLLP